MEKPLNEFGGWLRFFWVICLLSLIAVCLSIILNFFSFYASGSATIHVSFIVAQIAYFLEAAFFWLILVNLKKQDPAIPMKIVVFLFACAAMTLPYLFVKEELSYKIIAHSEFNSMPITAMVWSLYFKESKRVKAFYGANAIPKLKWFNKKPDNESQYTTK